MDPTIRRHEDDPITDRRREPGYDLPGERRPDTDWEPEDTDRPLDRRPGEGTAIDNEEGGAEALGAGAGLGDQAEEDAEESDPRDR